MSYFTMEKGWCKFEKKTKLDQLIEGVHDLEIEFNAHFGPKSHHSRASSS